MDVSLTAALVGTAAAVVAVPIAVLQLHQARAHARKLVISSQAAESAELPDSAGVEAVRAVLPLRLAVCRHKCMAAAMLSER